jgi:hypothetical protein
MSQQTGPIVGNPGFASPVSAVPVAPSAVTPMAASARGVASAIESLSSYGVLMETQIGTYSNLRRETSNFVDRIQSGYVTYDEAYAFFSQAQSDRETVRDAMSALAVPDSLASAHFGLVAVVSRGIAAVQSAYDGLYTADTCYYGNCDDRDTAGWRTFSSESSGISDAYATAINNWESTLAAAKAAAAGTALPPKPHV